VGSRWGVEFGEIGQCGGQEPVMDACEEHRGVQAVLGNVVAVGVAIFSMRLWVRRRR